jgi:phosphate starvation-inducible PhoH-like protein
MAFKPQTIGQSDFVRTITENDITICIGPAGTGKSSVSAAIAAEYFLNGKVEKIVITRPIIEAGKGLGFLPGDVNAKTQNYMIPIIEELDKWMTKELVDECVRDKRIDVVAPELMRGRNLNSAFIICDESQNMNFKQIKMLVTRLGRNSKLVISGDPTQTDLKEYESGALEIAYRALENLRNCGVCQLTNKDIVRNKILASVINALDDEYRRTYANI